MSEYGLTAADVDALRDELPDLNESDIRTDYSGRGMYGRTCIGVVGSDPILFAFQLAVLIARGEAGLEDGEDDQLTPFDIRSALEEIGAPSTDSMGYQTIHYWPNITVDTDDDDADGFDR